MDLNLFKEIVLKYKVVFFDAFGVLKNAKGLIEGVEDTFQFLTDHNIEFYVLTNDASRSPEELYQSYVKLGVNVITPDKIISSGMIAKDYLQLKVQTGTVVYLGTDSSGDYLQSAGLKSISIHDFDLENSSDVSALVFMDDEGFDWNDDINKTVNLLRQENIPVIVANTDATYPKSKNEINIAIGGIADMIEEVVGKHFIRFGKPDAQMFIYALEHVSPDFKLDKNDILMVGDTLYTDIIGGNKFGLDTALVLTGNTQERRAEIMINSTGIIPTYICESVAK